MQLGWVEELGSGVLNVSKYWQAYGRGAKPQFIEGVTFKTVLPLSEFFFAGNEDGNQDNLIVVINRQIDDGVSDGVSDGVNDGVNDGVRKEIIELVTVIMDNEGLKAFAIAAKRGKSKPTVERYLKLARQFSLIEFTGAPRTGGYYLTKLLRDSLENKKA